MKKYFKVVILVLIFALFVYYKNLKGFYVSPLITLNQKSQLQGESKDVVTKSKNEFADGTYLGSVEDAYYGNFQVQAVIQNGKLSDVNFLQYPNDNPTSQFVNGQAMPLLKQEAIKNQSAQVDIITGASDSSPAFSRSLQTALNKAKK